MERRSTSRWERRVRLVPPTRGAAATRTPCHPEGSEGSTYGITIPSEAWDQRNNLPERSDGPTPLPIEDSHKSENVDLTPNFPDCSIFGH